MNTWIPVKAVLPASGVEVFVTYRVNGTGPRRRVRAIYADRHTLEISLELGPWEGCDYDEVADVYYCPEGWYEVCDNWDEYTHFVITDPVTHWMPLPPFPED